MGKNKKKALKEQIEITKEQIRSNSKDVAFANKLIGNLLSLKGQFDLDPSILHVSTKEVIKSFDMGEADVAIISADSSVESGKSAQWKCITLDTQFFPVDNGIVEVNPEIVP